MAIKAFESVAMNESNPKYHQAVKRENALYPRDTDKRDEFERDYTRILHCEAFRRLKHKTQVFYAPHNDHVCTRIEHSLLVVSVAKTICHALGLNESLACAIALAHDLGHAPFGHHGEDCLNKLIASETAGTQEKKPSRQTDFWHERNSLFFADFIETLPTPDGGQKCLDLTYATRDGIICHCGEADCDKSLRPRKDAINLYTIAGAGSVAPFTWEGCVVRLSDTISYLGRDIEDAIQYGIISEADLKTLSIDNKTKLINDLITALCNESSIDKGLCYPAKIAEHIKRVKTFCIEKIYNNWRLLAFKDYAWVVLKTLYDVLINRYKSGELRYCPTLSQNFGEWLSRYESQKSAFERPALDEKDSYKKCVIEYISGLSDMYALRLYNEVISF